MSNDYDINIVMKILKEFSGVKFYKKYISNIIKIKTKRFEEKILFDYIFAYKGILYSLDSKIIENKKYIYKLSCKE